MKVKSDTRWAPSPVISGVITPIRRFFFHPRQTHLFSAVYRGPMSLHVQLGSGHHLVGFVASWLSQVPTLYVRKCGTFVRVGMQKNMACKSAGVKGNVWGVYKKFLSHARKLCFCVFFSLKFTVCCIFFDYHHHFKWETPIMIIMGSKSRSPDDFFKRNSPLI